MLQHHLNRTNSRKDLLQLIDTPSSLDPKTEKYVYDQNRNLKLMEDVWNARKVSELEMRYDEKGFLISIKRKSDAAKAHYFEDRTLNATYSFTNFIIV